MVREHSHRVFILKKCLDHRVPTDRMLPHEVQKIRSEGCRAVVTANFEPGQLWAQIQAGLAPLGEEINHVRCDLIQSYQEPAKVKVMIVWERRKRRADDIAHLSRDGAGLESCPLPNKLEADQLLGASERQLPNNVHSSQSHAL